MNSATSTLIVCMHELPLEHTGGGVLLRELLRHFSMQQTTLAVFPAYPHQKEKIEALQKELSSEGIQAVPMEVKKDWGKKSFTARRLLSPLPGCSVAFRNPQVSATCASLASQYPAARWLAISPFATEYLPDSVPPAKASLYYTNVDADIVSPSGLGPYRRIEASLERLRVTRYVKNTARRASRLAAITQSNAATLSSIFQRTVSYVPPLMIPKPVNREHAQPRLALITTNYTYAHNRVSMEWFMREVWPLTDPRTNLEVSGMDNAKGELARILSKSTRCQYLGFVTKPDLEAAFRRCALVVNPTISGSGFQIKLLDALARGITVVSTKTSNPFADEIPSADQATLLAGLISRHSQNPQTATFDYKDFYRMASNKWSVLI